MNIIATRKERVILELEDRFTKDMAKAAASAAALRRELGGLSGTSVQTSRDSDRVKESVKGLGDETEKTSKKTRESTKSTREYTLAMAVADEKAARLRKSLRDQAKELVDVEQGAKRVGDEVDQTGKKLRDGERDIDRYSGRLRLLTEAAVTLGPALIPIGAAAVPAITGLAASLGAAAGAFGVTLLAAQGLGDGLKAIDAYQLQPTTENLAKMREALDKLGPAGAQFARYLDSIEPQFVALQDAARAGMFPGVEEGINHLLGLLPQVRTIIFEIAKGMGNLASEAGAGLAGNAFTDFFNYLETDARPTLEALGHSVGNVAEGLASLTVAFAPLSRDFSSGMESMTRSFADWAAGLSKTQGFKDFVEYVRESGPKVVDLLGALGNAFVGIVSAAAPVGDAVLPALTTLANILGDIANSPIGQPLFTAAAALIAVSRATTLVNAGLVRVRGSALATSAGLQGIAKAGAGLVAVVGTANLLQAALDKIANTRIDSSNLSRDLEALSRGEVTDNLKNLASAFQDIGDKWQRDANPLSWISSWDPSGFEAARDTIKSLDDALATMVESGDQKTAAKAFAEIAKQAAVAGVSVDEVRKRFPEYATALDNAAASSDNAAGSMRGVGRAAGLSAAQVEAMTQSMQDQVSAAGSAFDAVTRYAEALKTARDAAAKGARGIDASTKAGRENRDALAGLRDAWNNQGDAIRNNLSKYAAARQSFIDLAQQMGVGSDKARRLADDMLAIPKFINTRVNAYTDDAKKQIQGILTELASIPRSISTTYYVNRVNAINKGGYDPNPDASHAVGGFTGRGAKYQPAGVVHAGEVVLPQEIVRRDKSLLMARYGFLPGMHALPGFASGGFVPSGGWASIGAGGTPRFDSLLAQIDKFGYLLAGINGLGEKELKHRATLLDKDQSLAEKALSIAKDRLNEERQQLKDLRDARKQFAQEVAANFRTDIFGGNLDLESAAKQGLLGPDFAQNLLQFIRDNNIAMTPGSSLTDYAGQYLQTLTPQQIAALQAQASVGTLQQNSADAQAFEQVLQQLHDMGLTGGAFNELAGSGNLAQAQAYLAMGPDFIKTLMQDFQQRRDDLRNLGKYVGNERFGADIRDQLKETRRAVRVAEEQRQELREIKNAQRDIAQRLDRIEKNSPKKTGDAVAAAVNGAVSHGQKKG